jgi:hypothetical protein
MIFDLDIDMDVVDGYNHNPQMYELIEQTKYGMIMAKDHDNDNSHVTSTATIGERTNASLQLLCL